MATTATTVTCPPHLHSDRHRDGNSSATCHSKTPLPLPRECRYRCSPRSAKFSPPAVAAAAAAVAAAAVAGAAAAAAAAAVADRAGLVSFPVILLIY